MSQEQILEMDENSEACTLAEKTMSPYLESTKDLKIEVLSKTKKDNHIVIIDHQLPKLGKRISTYGNISANSLVNQDSLAMSSFYNLKPLLFEEI
jgi:hypothetical protein